MELLTVRVQKSTDGRDFLQIGDPAMLNVNIVLIADRIEVHDDRKAIDL